MIERDLPASELQAVRKSWKDVGGLLEDCEKEIKEIVDGGEGGEEFDEDDDDEEEQEEKEELSEKEKEIVLGAHTLLRLSRLLINRLLTLTNSTTPTTTKGALPKKFESEEFLTGLTKSIKRISEKADDLAGVLEDVEEEKEGIEKCLEEIVKIGEKVSREIEEAYEEQDEEGTTEGGKSTKRQGEWFEVWRGQRDKAHQSILGALR